MCVQLTIEVAPANAPTRREIEQTLSYAMTEARCDRTGPPAVFIAVAHLLEIVPHSEHSVMSHCDRDRPGETHVEGYNPCCVIPPLQEGAKVVIAVVEHVNAS